MANPTRYLNVGLNGYQRVPDLMPTPHRHNEVEFVYLMQGQVRYLFGKREVQLLPKTLTLFWSGMDHQVLEASPSSLICGIEIPLAWCLHWKLPQRMTQALLAGSVLHEHDEAMSKSDGVLLSRWADEIQRTRPMARRAALLEIESRLWRFASSKRAAQSGEAHLAIDEASRIERMARFIAENCQRSLRVHEVAKTVGLHPNYAMKLFRKGFGVNFNGYLNQLRIAHAQRALATEDAKITEVGINSGFGSLSRFNSNFRKSCGMSPRAYRKAFGIQ